jgi:putative GTP pyrophosphokinase
MAYASEVLARAHEGLKGPTPEISDHDLVEGFLSLDKELNLIKTLRGLNSANKAVSEKRNAILIFGKSGSLDVRTFRDAPDALRALFELERQFPDQDIVLVKADKSDDVRLAFKNYFSDARDFIKLIESGCEKLTLGNK